MTEVTTSLAGLTPKWLTDCLTDRYPGIHIGAVRVEPLDVGPSFHGNLGRVELLDVSGADAPSSLVAKLVSASQSARELGVGMGIYLREAMFYEQLAPSVRLQPPACYGMARDLETGLSAILLEDLSDLEVGVQAAGYTPEKARSTVLQLADHHAAFWNGEKIAGLAWLPVWNQPEMVGFVVSGFAQVWPACQALLAGHLDAADIEIGNRLAAKIGELMDAIAEPPVTLLHGDARFDNLLFDPTDGTVPPRTVDWQFVAVGRGMRDIAYFLTQSGEAALAATEERGLVAAYHERLAKNGVGGYDADACWDDYRRFALYSLVYPLFSVAMIDPSDNTMLDATAAILRRGLDAAIRLDSVSLL